MSEPLHASSPPPGSLAAPPGTYSAPPAAPPARTPPGPRQVAPHARNPVGPGLAAIALALLAIPFSIVIHAATSWNLDSTFASILFLGAVAGLALSVGGAVTCAVFAAFRG